MRICVAPQGSGHFADKAFNETSYKCSALTVALLLRVLRTLIHNSTSFQHIGKIVKKLLPAALLISAFVATAPSYAATSTISKTITPANVFIFSNGSGGTSAEYFNLTGSDFPGNQLSAPKTLTSIDFAAASYIGATSDAAQICYYLPYTTQPAACHDITPGTSMAGYTLFNNFQFGNGAQVAIRHNVIGTPGASLRPSGTENVTFHYSY